MNAIAKHLRSFLKRFAVLGDKSAFLLTAPFAGALYLVDSALAKTLLSWILFAPVLAGVAIVVSRLTFPHIDLGDHADSARQGNTASGIVVGAIIVFVALTMLALVLWAKS